ncbi:MAG: hypothetical protein KC486_24660, partial [Myxococcales bacterium]|nr:hypothetical protein [Myxococcales bacterium]
MPPLATVRVGDQHICALDREGAVWCAGSNERGQLGRGTRSPREPVGRV